jgi:hypothetical protein
LAGSWRSAIGSPARDYPGFTDCRMRRWARLRRRFRVVIRNCGILGFEHNHLTLFLLDEP